MKTLQRVLAILVVLGLCLAAVPLMPLSATEGTGAVLAQMPAEFARLQASGLPYKVYPEPYTLRLGEQSFDTRLGGPDLPAGWEAVRSVTADLHLVQLAGPTRAEWLDGLRAGGLEIVQYIHPFTYIVWGTQAAVNGVAAEEFVHWTGPFAPAFRVLPQWRNLPDEPVQVSVLLVRAADTGAAIDSLANLSQRSHGQAVLNGIFEIAKFTLSGARLQEAARIPGVYSIQLEPTDGGLRGEMSDQICVNNHDGSNLAYPGYLDWLAAAGVDGNGVIIANVDGGVQDDHPDLVNRMVSCTGDTCGGSTVSSHGTHTAGLMAADGSSGVEDIYGFLRGLGMAPGANLVEQVYSPWYTQPGGMLKLMTESYNNGASLSGNSWGPAGTPQGYDDDTLQVDIGVRDADPNAPGNQPFNYILSIMNGNGGYQTQGTPDEAKNIFTIGSTKMQNGDGSQILEINDLSANTAHGPCLDGRLIPHMVAPGCEVDSTYPTDSYGLACGTSMASPHVSGAVALFIEYYRNLFGVDPSAALIKGAFLPVAHDLAGNEDADGNILGHPFDYKQGWGRMDTAAVVSPTMLVEYFDNPLIFDNTGEEWVQGMGVADPSQPLRLMLVWTDAPGHGLGGSTPAWNNDLDLVVEAGGDTYYGNNFDANGWSQSGGSADYMNNTEGVFLGPIPPGSVTVRVVASNINSDGIPNQGDDTDQDFALVCYNCALAPDFVMDADPGAFEVCTPEVVTSTIEVGQVLGYTEPVTLAVLNVPAGVTADINPTVVTPPGEAILTLDVGGGTADGTYTLIVSGTAEMTNVHTVEVDLLTSSDIPDEPVLLSPVDGASGLPYEEVTFIWSSLPQVRNYGLQVDPVATFDAPVVDETGISTGTYTLDTPLQPATCYFWWAMGENACGAGSWAMPFRFATVLLGQIFLDDVESGEGDWTATGLWHVTTVGSNPCAEAHSGLSSWYYGQEPACDYDTGSSNSGTLTLDVPLDLSDALAPATLRFWSWEETEGAASWDTRKVYLSDDGSSWSEVWASTNNNASWYQVEIDASSYVGGDLYIRFEFDTGDDYANNYRGWYVDDVEVIAGLPPSDPPDILSITPDSGSAYEDTPVVIAGSNFVATPNVKLGDTWLLSVTLVSSTTLEAVVPAGMEAGVYDLMLYNGHDCQEAVLSDAFTVIAQCISPTVTLTSDSPVELGQPMHFVATLESGTPPLTYTWDFGGPGAGIGLDTPTPVFTYTEVGTYTAVVTVENPCGDDTAPTTVVVNPAPVCTDVANVDLARVTVGTIYTDTLVEFEADVAPDDASKPYSYTVDYDDGTVVAGDSSDDPLALAHTFAATGTYAVEVAVWNCEMEVPATDVVTVTVYEQGVCVDLAGITIQGETEGEPGVYTFTTSYEPVDASLPISYTWDNGDVESTSVRNLGVGPHTLMVTATNCAEALVTVTHTIVVSEPVPEFYIYLPLVLRNSDS